MLSLSTLHLVFRNIGRALLDAFYIPGLVTGTEIAWLYLVQWKNETFRMGVAVVVVLCSVMPGPDPSKAAERIEDEVEG